MLMAYALASCKSSRAVHQLSVEQSSAQHVGVMRLQVLRLCDTLFALDASTADTLEHNRTLHPIAVRHAVITSSDTSAVVTDEQVTEAASRISSAPSPWATSPPSPSPPSTSCQWWVYVAAVIAVLVLAVLMRILRV